MSNASASEMLSPRADASEARGAFFVRNKVTLDVAMAAIRCDDDLALRKLICCGSKRRLKENPTLISPNVICESGRMLLVEAMLANANKCVGALVALGADPDFTMVASDGGVFSPMFVAVENNWIHWVDLFLQPGGENKIVAKVNASTAGNVTALMVAAKFCHYELCQKLVAYGARADIIVDDGEVRGITPLYVAIVSMIDKQWQDDAIFAMADLLLRAGGAAVINQVSAKVTILDVVAYCKFVNVVQYLRDRGAKLAAEIASANDAESVEVPAAAAASFPVSLAVAPVVSLSQPQIIAREILRLTNLGMIDEASVLLKSQVKPEYFVTEPSNYLVDVICAAVRRGSDSLFHALCEYVNVNSVCADGLTLLGFVGVYGTFRMFDHLLNVIKADPNYCNAEHTFPLCEVIAHQGDEMFCRAIMLIEDGGAHTGVVNSQGLTAFDCAIRIGHLPLAERLCYSAAPDVMRKLESLRACADSASCGRNDANMSREDRIKYLLLEGQHAKAKEMIRKIPSEILRRDPGFLAIIALDVIDDERLTAFFCELYRLGLNPNTSTIETGKVTTVLRRVAAYGTLPMLRYALSQGEDPRLMLHNEHLPLLMKLVKRLSELEKDDVIQRVKVLLAAGANPALRNAKNKSAFDYVRDVDTRLMVLLCDLDDVDQLKLVREAIRGEDERVQRDLNLALTLRERKHTKAPQQKNQAAAASGANDGGQALIEEEARQAKEAAAKKKQAAAKAVAQQKGAAAKATAAKLAAAEKKAAADKKAAAERAAAAEKKAAEKREAEERKIAAERLAVERKMTEARAVAERRAAAEKTAAEKQVATAKAATERKAAEKRATEVQVHAQLASSFNMEIPPSRSKTLDEHQRLASDATEKPLHWSVCANDEAQVLKNLHPDYIGQAGVTRDAYAYAAYNANPTVLAALLETDESAPDYARDFWFAGCWREGDASLIRDDVEAVRKLLVLHGCFKCSPRFENDQNVLHVCVQRDDVENLKLYLHYQAADMNQCNGSNMTPLSLAVALQKLSLCQLVLERADAQITDATLISALDCALQLSGNEQIASLLRDHIVQRAMVKQEGVPQLLELAGYSERVLNYLLQHQEMQAHAATTPVSLPLRGLQFVPVPMPVYVPVPVLMVPCLPVYSSMSQFQSAASAAAALPHVGFFAGEPRDRRQRGAEQEDQSSDPLTAFRRGRGRRA